MLPSIEIAKHWHAGRFLENKSDCIKQAIVLDYIYNDFK